MKHILLNEHLRSKFGERVQRLPLDPGFSCPNRDKDSQGCIFCDDTGSAATWIKKDMNIADQLKKGAQIAVRRYHSKKYIAYFQAFTTTCGGADVLEEMYAQALEFPGVVGLAVSTRPDSVSEEVMAVLEKFAKKTYLWVELGAQSMHNKSLDWMGRGHKAKDFTDAVKRFKSKNIEVVGHLIFGLPTENKEEMLESFRMFLNTGVSGYKIHALHIIRDTRLAKLYEEAPFNLLTMDEYIDLVKQAIAMTPSNVVIHRVTGEVNEDKLIAPKWIVDKNEIRRRIFE